MSCSLITLGRLRTFIFSRETSIATVCVYDGGEMALCAVIIRGHKKDKQWTHQDGKSRKAEEGVKG